MPRSPEDSGDTPDWDPEKVDDFLKMERSVNPTDVLSNVELTRQLIEQAAPHAAMSMIHLARHAVNENTKANCAKWVVEFASQIETEDGKAAWEKFLPDVVAEAEKITVHASAQGETPVDPSDFEVGE
jgi:hypothetical protein